MNQTLISALLFIVSILLAMFYIQPQFSDLSKKRANVSKIDEAIEYADEILRIMGMLDNDTKKISPTDNRRMDGFMPPKDTVDLIEIAKEIVLATKKHNLSVSNLTIPVANEPKLETSVAEAIGVNTKLYTHTYSLSVSGSYEDMKAFMKSLENNAYPLWILEFSIKNGSSATNQAFNPGGRQNYDYQLTLETYVYE